MAIGSARFVGMTLTVLLVLALVSGAAGMVLDNSYEVRASTVIEAPVDAIIPFVESPRQHGAWLGWNDDADPSLRRTYEGPESGAGAGVHWEGEGFGVGSLQITSADTEGVSWQQRLPAGVQSEGRVVYRSLSLDRTRVTYTERGTIPRPHGAYFVGTVERVMTPHAERALAFLSAAAEGRPPPSRQAGPGSSAH